MDLARRLVDVSGSASKNRTMRHKKPLAAMVTAAVAVVAGWGMREAAAESHLAPHAAAVPQIGPTVPPQPRPRPHSTRTVALTFDDGPSRYTAQILAVLRRNHVRATFCVLGNNVKRHPAAARQLVREGHQLCNHTRDHANMARLSRAKARAEVTDTQREIHAATGVKPKIFRFPYGSSDAQSRKVVAGLHLRRLGWDVDPQDWRKPAARKITARIVAHAHPRCVVLMHDGGGDRSHTAASLDATIKQLRQRGYQFVLA